MLQFILIRSCFHIISECLQYCMYPFHKEHLTKLTHLQHQHQDIKRFYYNFNQCDFQSTFYTNIDVNSLNMTHKIGQKQEGVLVFKCKNFTL